MTCQSTSFAELPASGAENRHVPLSVVSCSNGQTVLVKGQHQIQAQTGRNKSMLHILIAAEPDMCREVQMLEREAAVKQQERALQSQQTALQQLQIELMNQYNTVLAGLPSLEDR